MPRNRFPDSIEKRELRRRDRELLKVRQKEAGRGLEYCGMPSVEFLDVVEWKDLLSRVVALENQPEIFRDMEIVRDNLSLPFSVHIIYEDILDYLVSTSEVFDVYNLDFFGGFLNVTSGPSRSLDALRSMFARQARARRSFALIATFNVKELGSGPYTAFLSEVQEHFGGLQGAAENIAAHGMTVAAKQKLCFLYFCWQLAMPHSFDFTPDRVFVYTSSVTMVHFHIWLNFTTETALKVTQDAPLIHALNRPLYRLDGMIPRPEIVPPRMSK